MFAKAKSPAPDLEPFQPPHGGAVHETSQLQLFHVSGIVLVPVKYDCQIKATTADEAAKAFASHVAAAPSHGELFWDERSPAIIAKLHRFISGSWNAVAVPARFTFQKVCGSAPFPEETL